MIEINLTPKEKQKSITKVAGIDLSLINVKYLVFAIVFLYAYEPIINTVYDPEIEGNQAKERAYIKEYKKLNAELRTYDQIKEEVKNADIQEKKLILKIDVIKQIVQKRQNPFQVLKYIADNTPGGVWLTELVYESETLTLTGYSKDFKGINDFMENLKNSIFVNGELSFSTPEKAEQKIDNVVVEAFTIKMAIGNGQ